MSVNSTLHANAIFRSLGENYANLQAVVIVKAVNNCQSCQQSAINQSDHDTRFCRYHGAVTSKECPNRHHLSWPALFSRRICFCFQREPVPKLTFLRPVTEGQKELLRHNFIIPSHLCVQ